MHDTKLIRTLRTLNRKELIDFGKYCDSQFTVVNNEVTRLLRHLLKYKPDFQSARLRKEIVFDSIFKNKAYDDSRMRLLISDALKIVNQFIGIKMVLSSPVNFEMHLLEHFSQAENNELTLKRFDEFRKKLDAISYRDEHYFYLKFRLEELKSNYYAARSREYDLSALFEMLEGFYFLNKIKMLCVRLSSNYIFRNEVDEQFISEIREMLKRKTYLENPVALGYSHGLLLHTDSEPEIHFNLLYDILKDHGTHLSPYDQRLLSKLMENHCIRQVNKGNERYYEPLYSLLERRLNDASEISAGEAKTYVTLCLRTGRSGIGKRFIHDKKDAIVPVEIREDAFNYSMALIHFYKKNYDEVLSLLQQVEYLNVFYKIDSKKLLLETFYEMNEWDSLDSAMNAFRVFIHRNTEISELHKKNNQNFINFLYRLLNEKSNQKRRLQQLQQQLKKGEHIAERRWLLEKVGEKMNVR